MCVIRLSRLTSRLEVTLGLKTDIRQDPSAQNWSYSHLPPIQVREGNSQNALNIHLVVFGRLLRSKLFKTVGELFVLNRDHA